MSEDELLVRFLMIKKRTIIEQFNELEMTKVDSKWHVKLLDSSYKSLTMCRRNCIEQNSFEMPGKR